MDHHISHLSLTFCRSFLQARHLGVFVLTTTKSVISGLISGLRTSRPEAASTAVSECAERERLRVAGPVGLNTMAALTLFVELRV